MTVRATITEHTLDTVDYVAKRRRIIGFFLIVQLPRDRVGIVRGFLKHFAPDELRSDEISILEDAFEDAWRRVEQSKAPWASADFSSAGRTILARYIIAMAKGGERDARWLADSAVLYLSQQKLTRTPPEAA